MNRFEREVLFEGLNIEKLIQQAGKVGIQLQDVKRVSPRKLRCIMMEKDLEQLKAITEAGGWRMQTGRRIGAARAYDLMKKRVLLVAGLLVITVLLFAATTYVWHVEILDAGSYEADLHAYLQEMGVKPLVTKQSIQVDEIRNALEWRYPEAAWIEVGWRGTTLQVRMIQGRAAGETLDGAGACDLIAERDGIVTEIIPVAGTPMVKPGQIIRKGEVLIKGEERTEKGGTIPVAARGRVMARVWDAAAAKMSIMETETIYTGRTHTVVQLELPWFPLSKEQESGYAAQDVSAKVMPIGGLFIPVTMRVVTSLEANTKVKKRDLQQVQAEAEKAAMQKLREKIGFQDDLVDKWVEFSMIDSEILCAVAYGERVIDIARAEHRQ